MKYWTVGDTLVIRHIAKSDGTVSTALTSIVIRDDDNLLAVYIPKGSPYKNNWVIPAEQRVASVTNITPSAQRPFKDTIWQNNSIRLYFAGRGYSIWAFFDDDNSFSSWYGNLEAPYVRIPIGIDTRDFALDIVANDMGKWHWKDEDEFQRRLEVGIDTSTHQSHVRRAAHQLIELIENHASPFSDGWQDWQPPADWSPRPLPSNWYTDFNSHHTLSTATW